MRTSIESDELAELSQRAMRLPSWHRKIDRFCVISKRKSESNCRRPTGSNRWKRRRMFSSEKNGHRGLLSVMAAVHQDLHTPDHRDRHISDRHDHRNRPRDQANNPEDASRVMPRPARKRKPGSIRIRITSVIANDRKKAEIPQVRTVGHEDLRKAVPE